MRTIAHLSDLHFGRHDPAKAEALRERLVQSRPDIVAVSGDFTQRAREREFQAARRFLDLLPQPKLVVPGNHDVPLFNLFKRWRKAFRGYDHHIAPVNVPDGFYADGEIALLGINTARRLTWKNGRISYAQMECIQDTLRPLPDAVWKILVTHHPLAFTGDESVTLAGRAAPALHVIDKARVHVLLSGHHHRAVSGAVDAELFPSAALLVVHAGTAISTRTRGAHGNSYNLIQTNANRLTVKVMAWQPEGVYAETGSSAYELSGHHPRLLHKTG